MQTRRARHIFVWMALAALTGCASGPGSNSTASTNAPLAKPSTQFASSPPSSAYPAAGGAAATTGTPAANRYPGTPASYNSPSSGYPSLSNNSLAPGGTAGTGYGTDPAPAAGALRASAEFHFCKPLRNDPIALCLPTVLPQRAKQFPWIELSQRFELPKLSAQLQQQSFLQHFPLQQSFLQQSVLQQFFRQPLQPGCLGLPA